MGKIKSLFNYDISIHRWGTIVDSKRYGRHVRAKRGTHTPITLNASCRLASKKTESANIPAKIVKDALRPFCLDFRDGSLWSRLVSAFWTQSGEGSEPDFSILKGFEINAENSLSRHIDIRANCVVNDKRMFCVTIAGAAAPLFTSHKDIDEYGLKLIIVFVSSNMKNSETQVIDLPRNSVNTALSPFEAAVRVPDDVCTALVCVKMNAWSKGYLSGNVRTKGMAIVNAVETVGLEPVTGGEEPGEGRRRLEPVAGTGEAGSGGPGDRRTRQAEGRSRGGAGARRVAGVPETGRGIQDSGFKFQDSGFMMQDTGSFIQVAREP